jgi:hypothetical protein
MARADVDVNIQFLLQQLEKRKSLFFETGSLSYCGKGKSERHDSIGTLHAGVSTVLKYGNRSTLCREGCTCRQAHGYYMS